MFNKYKKYQNNIDDLIKNNNSLEKEIEDIKHKHQLEIKDLEKEQELELKEKEFQLKHFKDETIKELEGQINEKDKTIAVLEKENKMLDKIVDLSSDVIDVKKLVQDLIKKLPEIKLKNLFVNSSNKK